jgi:hypothetical protein
VPTRMSERFKGERKIQKRNLEKDLKKNSDFKKKG